MEQPSRANKTATAIPSLPQTAVPTTTTNLANHRHSRRRRTLKEPEGEELVYVRLETLGANLKDLNTLAINERLLSGLFELLLEPELTRDDKNRQKKDKTRFLDDVRMQIFGNKPTSIPTILNHTDGGTTKSIETQDSSSRTRGKCIEAIEKFICRLVYPSCHFRSRDVNALVRAPCREDCLLLRDSLCPNVDWRKFSLALNEAFNITLSSMPISQLGLKTQGESSQADLATQRSDSSKASSLNTTSDGGKHEASIILDHQFHSTSGYNLNSSSIHFYWPHESSLRQCESLPSKTFNYAQYLRLARLRAHKTQRNGQQDKRRQSWPKNIGPTREKREQIRAEPMGRPTLKAGFNETKLKAAAAAAGISRQHGEILFTQNYGKTGSIWPSCSNAYLSSIGFVELDEEEEEEEEKKHIEKRSLKGDRTRLEPALECLMRADGVDYRGTKNRTINNLDCQSWFEQKPHSHSR